MSMRPSTSTVQSHGPPKLLPGEEPHPFARARLGAESRRRGRETARPGGPDLATGEDDGTATVVARDVLERAVAAGRLGPLPARLVWAARVEGRTPAELAALAGTGAEAASMARLRAERALRREVA